MGTAKGSNSSFAACYVKKTGNESVAASAGCLRTFVLIVFAHPYCAHNSCYNVTTCHASSVHAEKTFHSLLSQMVGGPQFVLIGSFVLQVSTDCKKNEQKVNVESLQISNFLPTQHQILPIFQLLGECKCDHLTIRFSKGTSPVESICLIDPLKQYLDKKIAFHEFIRIIFGQTDTVAIVRNEGRFIRS